MLEASYSLPPIGRCLENACACGLQRCSANGSGSEPSPDRWHKECGAALATPTSRSERLTIECHRRLFVVRTTERKGAEGWKDQESLPLYRAIVSESGHGEENERALFRDLPGRRRRARLCHARLFRHSVMGGKSCAIGRQAKTQSESGRGDGGFLQVGFAEGMREGSTG